MGKYTDRLGTGGKALEDIFFFEMDLVLIEKKRQLRNMERSLATLSDVSGIADKILLRKLVDLNIQVDVLATLSLIPLIEIAWADGKIDEKERQELAAAASRFGVLKGQVNRELFEHWLNRRPPEAMIESWIYYMQGLCQLLNPAERGILKAGFLQWAQKIAEAETADQKRRARTARRRRDILLRLERAFEPLAYKV
jgi:hypothetical protein